MTEERQQAIAYAMNLRDALYEGFLWVRLRGRARRHLARQDRPVEALCGQDLSGKRLMREPWEWELRDWPKSGCPACREVYDLGVRQLIGDGQATG